MSFNRFKWDVHPLPVENNIVVGNSYRFTVLTPALIRLEYDDSGIFEDRASQVVFYRDFPECRYSVCEHDGVITLETDELVLTYDTSSSFADGLTMKLKNEPASSWRFGEPFETLGGTTETLDQVDGRCYMGDGVCSRNGFSVLDDGENYGDGLAGEKILLQGVVDCAVVEPDGIIIVDFKTDKVTEQTVPLLTQRYSPQVKTYAQAMERIFGQPVKQSYLYFFQLDRAVPVD